MAGLERRTPRSVREAQAYRAVQVAAASAAATLATFVLWIVGAMGDSLAIIFALITVLAALRVASVTGWRERNRRR